MPGIASRKLFLKFLAWTLPVFMVLTSIGLFLATDFVSRTDMDSLTARVGNHAGRIAIALGRHDAEKLEAFGHDLLGSLLAEPAVASAELRRSGQSSPLLTAPRHFGCKNVAQAQVLELPSGRNGNRLTVYFTTDEVHAAARQYRLALLATLGMALLGASLAGAFGFRQSVGKPLTLLADAIRKSRETGESVLLPIRRNDELGLVIEAYNALQESLAEAHNRIKSEATLLAREEQRARQAELITAGMEHFHQEVIDMIEQLDTRVGQITEISLRLGDSSTGVTAAARDLEAKGRKNASETAKVTKAFQDLDAISGDIAQRVRNSLEAGRAVRDSHHVVQHRLADLSNSIGHISEATTLIGKIAQQTNLLALNATIEAARAGETGRGFAVVAAEVKVLSRDTALAAAAISKTVEQVSHELSLTLGAADSLNTSAHIIDDSSAFIGDALSKQELAIHAIDETASATNEAAVSIAKRLEDMLRLARRSETAAFDMRETSEVMHAVSARLQAAVEKLHKDLAA